VVNELHWTDPRRAFARYNAYLHELGFPFRGRDLYIFYGLSAWAGINIALLFDVVVGRSPSGSEMAVTSLAAYSLIMMVTLPFLKAEGFIGVGSQGESVDV
jgi:hypothetical protein